MVLLKSRRRARLHVLHELRVAQGTRARGEPARGAALPPPGHPGARRGPRRAGPAGGVRRVLGDAARRRRAAAPRRRTSRSRSAPARSSRRRSPRSRAEPRAPDALGRLPARPGHVRVLAAPRRPSARTSPVQGDAAAGGRCYFCNREELLAAAAAALSLAAAASAPRPAPPSSAAARSSRRRAPGTQRVDTLPVAANSATLIASIGDGRRARRLRLRPLGRLAHRHPVRRRARQDDAEVARHVRLRGRERQGAVPDPGERADRGRTRHANDGDRHALIVDRDSCKLYELYALQRTGSRLGGRLGRDLEPPLERAAAGDVDVGRRGRPADPARARALGRRRLDRRDQPRAALHRRAHAQRVRLPGAPLGDELDRSVAAADGAARAAEGERQHLEAAAAGAHRRAGDEDATG